MWKLKVSSRRLRMPFAGSAGFEQHVVGQDHASTAADLEYGHDVLEEVELLV